MRFMGKTIEPTEENDEADDLRIETNSLDVLRRIQSQRRRAALLDLTAGVGLGQALVLAAVHFAGMEIPSAVGLSSLGLTAASLGPFLSTLHPFHSLALKLQPYGLMLIDRKRGTATPVIITSLRPNGITEFDKIAIDREAQKAREISRDVYGIELEAKEIQAHG